MLNILDLISISSKKAGLPPGTPVHTGEQKVEETKITIYDYNKDSLSFLPEAKNEDISRLLKTDTVTWINITGLHNINFIEAVGKTADLHPLIIEDILNTKQRPKLDPGDKNIFIVIKTNFFNEEKNIIEFEQISIILSKNHVITFQEQDNNIFNNIIKRIEKNMGRLRKSGADYLAYAILDVIVDNYFALLEVMGDRIEDIEDRIMENSDPENLHKIHGIKKELIYIRKSIWPLREVISGLERIETNFIKKSTHIFLRDLYDHTIQVVDTVEIFRDLIAGILDIYISTVSNKMNEIMKTLTVFMAVFIPLTLITGIYGMNFNHNKSPYNMPELNWFYGYPFAICLMVVISTILLAIFKKKKWF